MSTTVESLPGTRNGNKPSVARQLARYPEYRDSEVEWLEDVPAHWKVRRLKYIGWLNYGDSLPQSARTETGSVFVYGSNGPVGKHDVANTRGATIIIGRKGSFGKVTFSGEACFTIDTAYYTDGQSAREDINWLAYALPLLKLDEFSDDSAVPGLSRDYTHNRQLPVPPLPEQRTIAAFLDRETERIDTLISKKQHLIELLEENRTALIRRAVTKGLDPDAAMKDPGVEWLGEVPAHWDVRRLKSTIEFCRNGIWGGAPEDDATDIACVRVADFDRTRNRISPGDLTVRSIPERKRPGRLLHPDDLLIEKSGGGDLQPVGAVVQYDLDQPAVCSNFIARMPVRDKHDSDFLCYLHATLYEARVNTRSIKQNTGIQNLDSDQYLAEPAALPPLPEQHAIAAFLNRETGRIDSLVRKIHEHTNLLREYRTALISAAVTGKIDVREEVAT